MVLAGAERRVCFLSGHIIENVPAESASPHHSGHHFGPHIKIIEQNATLESTSRRRLMNNVLRRIKEDLLPPQSTPEETGPRVELVPR